MCQTQNNTRKSHTSFRVVLLLCAIALRESLEKWSNKGDLILDDKVGDSIDGIGIERGVDGLGEGVLGCNHFVWLILFHTCRQDMNTNQANQFRQIFQAICYCINTVQQTDKITLFT